MISNGRPAAKRPPPVPEETKEYPARLMHGAASMPNYKSGTPARVGDLVAGHTLNMPHPIAGTIISLRAGGNSCAAQVQWTQAVPLAEYQHNLAALTAAGGPLRMMRHPAPGLPRHEVARIVRTEDFGDCGPEVVLVECVDYANTDDLDLVGRGAVPAVPLPSEATTQKLVAVAGAAK